MAKNPPTADILAQLRAEAGGAGSSDEAAPDVAPEAPEVAPAAPEVTTEPAAAAPSGGAKAQPKSGATSDILAALRAEAKGGGEAPAAEKPAAPAPAATPAAGGAPPKNTSDILAALRAQSGQGGAPAGDSPAAKPAAAAKKPAAMPEGDKPSVLEMIRAARGEAPAAAAPATKPAPAAKPTLPPLPTKPPAKKGKKEPETRRNFLVAMVATPFALAWTMFAATVSAATLGVARFMMPNVLVEPPSTFKVGPPSDFPPGTVSTKFKAQFGVWLVHADYEGQPLIYALSTVCTHLGCTPNWLEGEQKFKCPCHGSGFYITGVNFEGPAPRPLERHGIRVAPDGMLEVDKGRKFQQELGQWEDAACKVEVA